MAESAEIEQSCESFTGHCIAFLPRAKRGGDAPKGRRGPFGGGEFPLHRFAVREYAVAIAPTLRAGEERGEGGRRVHAIAG